MGWVDWTGAADDDRHIIEKARPGIMAVPSRVTQPSNPQDEMPGLRDVPAHHLPDPTFFDGPIMENEIQTEGRFRYGMTYALTQTMRKRIRPFAGQVAALPHLEANPVQGYVGRNQRHQGALSAGVRDQLTNYTGTLRSFAESLAFLGRTVAMGTGKTADSSAGDVNA